MIDIKLLASSVAGHTDESTKQLVETGSLVNLLSKSELVSLDQLASISAKRKTDLNLIKRAR